MRSRMAWVGLMIVLSRVAAGQGAAATQAAAATQRAAATQGVKAEEVLKAKGLTKVGITYLLEGDVKLPEGLRAMRLAKRRIEVDTAKRTQLEKALEQDKAELMLALNDAASVSDRMGRMNARSQVEQYNRLVGQLNAALARKGRAAISLEQHQAELSKLSDTTNDYVASVQDLSDKMEALAKRYEELVADAEVKGALAAITARGGPKVALGPSGAFKQELPGVRQQRTLVNGAAIKLAKVGGVPVVTVTLNGLVNEVMVVDSGAATVTLPWELAERAGVDMGGETRRVQIQTANGQVVDASLAVLKSVRVGQFVVEDVECVVLPKSAKDAMGLLGGTFLRHFVCRMDLGAGVLHMSQMSGQPTAESRAVASTQSADGGPAGGGPATRPGVVTDGRAPRPAVARGAAKTLQVTVSAFKIESDPVATGLRLEKGQTFTLKPNPADRWTGGGTKRGKWCDYRGYPDKLPWMQMRWKVGEATGAVVSGESVAAPSAGELMLFCSDGRIDDNEGAIGVGVTVTPPAAPAAQPARGAAPPVEGGKALFDGKSLAEWKVDPTFWSVSEGAIKGSFDGGPEGRYAYAPGTYGDFALDVEFKVVSGNSGVVFRSEPELERDNGYQADIFPNAYGKVSYNGKVLIRPEAAVQNDAYRPGEWNHYTVEAKGERLRVLLNGTLMADMNHSGGPREGRVGLEVYGKTEAYFREVRIREVR